MQVSGHLVETTAPLTADGHFEALVEQALPPARRGWRVARYHARLGDRSARACGVVLTAPAESARAVIVLLPLALTYQSDRVQRLAHSEQAIQLTSLLQRLEQTARGVQAIYYVAGVPPLVKDGQAQLALAATSLGWPTGQFVVVPASGGSPADALGAGLERLRWLLAGTLDLLILNQEPSFGSARTQQLESGTERPATSHPAQETEGAVEREDVSVPPVARASHVGPRPTRSRSVPRYPIVFCHGMLAMTRLRMRLPSHTNYFVHLDQFLRDRGVRAFFPQVEPTGGIETRAHQLRDQIQRWTDGPINLVAHSMGGLDCRFLITHLGLAERVRSLTTVCTPHHGSPVADWVCANYQKRIPLLMALDAWGIDVDGISACRLAPCRQFNATTPDVPGVRYSSYGAAVPLSQVTPFLRRAWQILTPREGPNDGLVSVASAHWGEYLGTLAVDHFAQTPDGLFVRPGENFDSVGFFFRLIEDLARRGF
jgi:triacylglycerol lipase